jgi:hypothetical protein
MNFVGFAVFCPLKTLNIFFKEKRLQLFIIVSVFLLVGIMMVLMLNKIKA